MKYFFLLLIVVLRSQAFAQNSFSQLSQLLASSSENSQITCPRQSQYFGNLQIQQIPSGNGLCYLTIHPRDAYDTLVYRDYLISNMGLLMVFNSYSADENPESTGAREYYFFPKEFKGYQWKLEDQNLIVQGFSNLEMEFNIETAQLVSLSGAELQIKNEITPANKGGIEILSFQGLFLDAGFSLGKSPSSQSSRSSVWKNAKGQQCKLRNQDSFRYQNEDSTLKTEAEMSEIIKKKCRDFLFTN